MQAVGASLATGHPAWPVDPTWDFSPLIISVLLIVLLRAARIPLRPVALVGAFAGGLVLDTLTDAMGVSTVTTMGALVAASALLALRRPRLG